MRPPGQPAQGSTPVLPRRPLLTLPLPLRRHLLAVMGPSGCGKSTLLDALANRLGKGAELSGEVLVNGHKAMLNYGRAAYVTQEDVLIGTLTVRETLAFAAKLRLPLVRAGGVASRAWGPLTAPPSPGTPSPARASSGWRGGRPSSLLTLTARRA